MQGGKSCSLWTHCSATLVFFFTNFSPIFSLIFPPSFTLLHDRGVKGWEHMDILEPIYQVRKDLRSYSSQDFLIKVHELHFSGTIAGARRLLNTLVPVERSNAGSNFRPIKANFPKYRFPIYFNWPCIDLPVSNQLWWRLPMKLFVENSPKSFLGQEGLSWNFTMNNDLGSHPLKKSILWKKKFCKKSSKTTNKVQNSQNSRRREGRRWDTLTGDTDSRRSG